MHINVTARENKSLKEIGQAVHICPGVMDALFPRDLALLRVVLLRDNFAHGPVRVDPNEHARVRRDYWKSYYGVQGRAKLQKWNDSVSVSNFHEFAKRVTSRPTPEIVIWRVPEQPLCDLWAMDCLKRMNLSQRKLFLCVSHRFAWQIAGTNSRGIETHRLSHTQLRTGAALWRKYASRRPAAVFNAFDKANERLFGIGKSIEHLPLLMPRRGDANGGRFRLSVFDERILKQLKRNQWLSAASLREFKCKSGYSFNHSMIAHRLRAWAEHASAHRLVESDLDSCAVNFLTKRLYRLTKFGSQCIKQGIDHLNVAPPMPVASWNLYVDSLFLTSGQFQGRGF